MEWGATSNDWALGVADGNGHVETLKLAKEWGAKEFDLTMSRSTKITKRSTSSARE